MAPPAAERGQVLDVECGATPLWVDADPQRLSQVFSNLLRNAIKFTGRGGRITFTADGSMSGIAVRVRDSGRGIDSQALPRIFDLFAQVQPSAAGGVGIGLSVVREIVTLHRGRIDARSGGLGHGSEFAFVVEAIGGHRGYFRRWSVPERAKSLAPPGAARSPCKPQRSSSTRSCFRARSPQTHQNHPSHEELRRSCVGVHGASVGNAGIGPLFPIARVRASRFSLELKS